MGSFYTNFTVRYDDHFAVADALRSIGRTAYVAPAVNGYTVVFDCESDMQDVAAIENVGLHLSRVLETAVLGILNHDDDILCYFLFRFGQWFDSYNSCPSYFDDSCDAGTTEFDAGKLCEAFGCTQNTESVKAILQNASDGEEGYVFAMDQHRDLVNALGLPDLAVGLGYNYIESGDLADDPDVASLIRIE